jgi:hypothetical protein
MWDYDSFVGKAQEYFSRATDHPSAEDEIPALWLLLGLEFLLRAPLARIHPTLLADPQVGGGNSIMQAAGFPLKVDGGPPRSITARTVITRLGAVIPGFKEIENEAIFLVELRNEELHGSESALGIDASKWMPQFTRVVDVVCSHLGIESNSFVGPPIMHHGRSLVGEEDKRLAREVASRIATAKQFITRLNTEEITARREAAAARRLAENMWRVMDSLGEIQCPACESELFLQLNGVRTSNERLMDDEIHRDVVYVATGMRCLVCELQLNSTAEIRNAGLTQQWVHHETESLEDRYMAAYADDDYGND